MNLDETGEGGKRGKNFFCHQITSRGNKWPWAWAGGRWGGGILQSAWNQTLGSLNPKTVMSHFWMSDEAFTDIVTFCSGLSNSAVIYGAMLVKCRCMYVCTFHPKGIFTNPKRINPQGRSGDILATVPGTKALWVTRGRGQDKERRLPLLQPEGSTKPLPVTNQNTEGRG